MGEMERTERFNWQRLPHKLATASPASVVERKKKGGKAFGKAEWVNCNEVLRKPTKWGKDGLVGELRVK
jgi:hypothetical protein